MKSIKRTVDVLQLTLWQLVALEGFRDQKALLEAVKRAGHELPQPQLSAMMNGSPEYPKARAAVAAVLLKSVPEAARDALLLRLVDNTKRKAQQDADA